MRVLTVATLMLALLASAALAKVPVGQTAPDFSAKSVDGKDISLAALGGKYVLVDFMATW